MDKPSHLSLILDLSPSQWLLSARHTNPFPLPFHTFLAHLLTFLNAHAAAQHDNTLAVFGAFPGKRCAPARPSAQHWSDPAWRVRSVQLFSSTDPHTEPGEGTPSLADAVADANAYRPFKLVDAAIARAIARELDLLGEQDEEGARCHPARPTLS